VMDPDGNRIELWEPPPSKWAAAPRRGPRLLGLILREDRRGEDELAVAHVGAAGEGGDLRAGDDRAGAVAVEVADRVDLEARRRGAGEAGARAGRVLVRVVDRLGHPELEALPAGHVVTGVEVGAVRGAGLVLGA